MVALKGITAVLYEQWYTQFALFTSGFYLRAFIDEEKQGYKL